MLSPGKVLLYYTIAAELYIYISVLVACSLQDRGISSDVFQSPTKFHLTVGVMRLFTQEEVVSKRR